MLAMQDNSAADMNWKSTQQKPRILDHVPCRLESSDVDGLIEVITEFSGSAQDWQLMVPLQDKKDMPGCGGRPPTARNQGPMI